MEKNQDFMNSSEMISRLDELQRAINEDIENRKLAYKGEDGKDYYDKESMDAVNKAYIEGMYKFIGRDGQEYGSFQELQEANETMFLSSDKQDLYNNNHKIL